MLHSSINLSSNTKCDTYQYEGCIFDQTVNIPHISSTTTTFTSCTFDSMSANDYGGAIYLSGLNQYSSLSLALDGCQFKYCSSADGGAIYADLISKLDVTRSIFLGCTSSDSTDNEGGGAIYIHSLLNHLSLNDNHFISCSSQSSGGAVYTFGCGSNVKGANIFNDCIFLSCKAPSTEADGGALLIWSNSQILGLVNSVFSFCSSYYGGALTDDFNGLSSSQHPIQFCLFYTNTGKYGNDVLLDSFDISQGCVFLHSFSNSYRKRVAYPGDFDCDNYIDSWLPQGSIYFGNLSSDLGIENIAQSEYTWLCSILFRFNSLYCYILRYHLFRSPPENKTLIQFF